MKSLGKMWQCRETPPVAKDNWPDAVWEIVENRRYRDTSGKLMDPVFIQFDRIFEGAHREITRH